MQTFSKEEAIQALVAEINKAPIDDLVEIYNELFPKHPTSSADTDRLRGQSLDYVNKGLEVEEILDLWNVVFPKDRNVWFDEEEDCFNRNEDEEAVRTE